MYSRHASVLTGGLTGPVQQDMLTVRENTRRNASSGFKPQSQYRPMLSLNPDRRRVTFLTRAPTASRKKQQRAPSPVPVGGEGRQRRDEAEAQALPLIPAPVAVEGETRQPSLTPALPPGATFQSTSERPPENNDNAEPQTELPTPTPPIVSHHIPTPTTTPDTSPAAHAPARRVRIQGPSPLHTAHTLTPSGSSSTHEYGHATPAPGGSQAPPGPTLNQSPVSTAMPPLPVGAAPPTPPAPPAPSAPSLWSPAAARSSLPLQSSVLPVSPDRPVIMPRAKNAPTPWAPASSSQPASPASSRPHVPSLTSSASQHSGNSGEQPTRRGFLNALRNKPSALASGSANAHRTSTYSSASAYSND